MLSTGSIALSINEINDSNVVILGNIIKYLRRINQPDTAIAESGHCGNTNDSSIYCLSRGHLWDAMIPYFLYPDRLDVGSRTVPDSLYWVKRQGVNMDNISFHNITWHNYTLELNNEIQCPISHESGYFVMNFEPLEIEVYSKDRNDLYNFFCEEFTVIWNDLACEDEKKLTLDAIEKKRIIEKLVKEVHNNGLRN